MSRLCTLTMSAACPRMQRGIAEKQCQKKDVLIAASHAVACPMQAPFPSDGQAAPDSWQIPSTKSPKHCTGTYAAFHSGKHCLSRRLLQGSTSAERGGAGMHKLLRGVAKDYSWMG
eukprot:1161712-Pelagomonas_calceolata.AAC.3